MNKKVYIETSIVSYLAARPSRNILAAAWQQVTRDWWEKQRPHFELFTSEMVLSEARHGDPDAVQQRIEKLQDIPDLEITEDIILLA